MSLPGVGFVFVLGVALAGIAYALYYQRPRLQPMGASNCSYSYPSGYDTNFAASNDENNCAICLNELETDLRQLPCSHTFHAKCINSWVQMNRICPICRKSL